MSYRILCLGRDKNKWGLLRLRGSLELLGVRLVGGLVSYRKENIVDALSVRNAKECNVKSAWSDNNISYFHSIPWFFILLKNIKK